MSQSEEMSFIRKTLCYTKVTRFLVRIALDIHHLVSSPLQTTCLDIVHLARCPVIFHEMDTTLFTDIFGFKHLEVSYFSGRDGT